MSCPMHRVFLVAGLVAAASPARAQSLQDPYAQPAAAPSPPAPPPQPAPPPPQPAPQPQPPQPQPQAQAYPAQPVPPQPYPPPAYPAPYYPPPPPEGSPSDASGALEMGMIGAVHGIVGGLVMIDLRDIDDGGIATMTVLGTTAAGGGLGWLAGDKLGVDKGESDLALVGMIVGATNGALLSKPLELHTDTEDWGPFLLGTTALGTAGSLAIGMKADTTRGQSMFAGTLAVSGLVSTLLGVAVVQGGELDDDDSALVSLALGMNAGMVVGLAVSPMVTWSYRRASTVSVATLVGTGAGLAAGSIITGDSKDARTISTVGLIGLWGGMVSGIAMTSGDDPDPRFRPRSEPPAPAAPAYTILPAVGADQVGFMVAGAM